LITNDSMTITISGVQQGKISSESYPLKNLSNYFAQNINYRFKYLIDIQTSKNIIHNNSK